MHKTLLFQRYNRIYANCYKMKTGKNPHVFIGHGDIRNVIEFPAGACGVEELNDGQLLIATVQYRDFSFLGQHSQCRVGLEPCDRPHFSTLQSHACLLGSIKTHQSDFVCAGGQQSVFGGSTGTHHPCNGHHGLAVACRVEHLNAIQRRICHC